MKTLLISVLQAERERSRERVKRASRGKCRGLCHHTFTTPSENSFAPAAMCSSIMQNGMMVICRRVFIQFRSMTFRFRANSVTFSKLFQFTASSSPNATLPSVYLAKLQHNKFPLVSHLVRRGKIKEM